MLCLSARGMRNVPRGDEFVFSFKDVSYKSCSVVADFLSPVIGMIHASDPLCSQFCFDFGDPHRYFEMVLQLADGCVCSAEPAAIPFILKVSQVLKNDELFEMAAATQDEGTWNVSNIVEIIKESRNLGVLCEKELDFLAENLYCFDEGELLDLDFEAMAYVLRSDKLIVKSEDWVFGLVKSMVDARGGEFIGLYDYVLFENLSEAEIKTFLKSISFSQVSPRIWHSLNNRMIGMPKHESKRYIYTRSDGVLEKQVAEVPYIAGLEVTGLLARNIRSFVSQAPGIRVTASSIYHSGVHLPSSILNFEDHTSYFMSDDQPMSWIQIDLDSFTVALTHYELRSFGNTLNSHLRSWTLSGSQDGDSFETLDVRNDDESLRKDWAAVTFECSQPSSTHFRYIRLTQTGPNHRGTNILLLRSIDFYGKVFAKKNART